MKLMSYFLMLVFCATTFAQTPEEMKAWEAYMAPSDTHKWLATMDGEWDADVTMWMDPSQPANKSKAVAVNKMIFDGRYQHSTHSGDLMGMPFNGESITAYDNAKKKFIATWIDNMGTGIMVMEGTYDDASKTLTMNGVTTDPMTGKDTPVTEKMIYHSKDSYTFEMYMVYEGKEMKTMEIVYNRKK